MLPPLSTQLKLQLIDLARELGLADGGRVADLRLRIRDHLTRNPKLLARQRYANLLPNCYLPPPPPPPPTTNPQPTHTSPDSEASNEIVDRRRAFRNGTSCTIVAQTAKGRPRMIPGCAPVYQLFTIPEVVQKEVIRGWLEHIPFTYLTDRFCLLDSNDQKINRELKINEHNQLIVETCLLNCDPKEYKLSYEDWSEASSRFLDLLQTYQPALHDLWESHFDRIRDAPDRSFNWSTWLRYDIYIRRQSKHEDIDPRIFHRQVWLGIRMELIKNISSRPGSHNPYDGRNRQRPSRRCLRCGGPHSARGCASHTLFNGLPVVVLPQEDCDVDGNRYCLSFNGSTGCTDTSCHKGLHWCSLCKGMEHNAQSCPFI